MAKTGLDKFKIGSGLGSVVLLNHATGDPDQQANRVRALERTPDQLGDQLGHGQPVASSDVIQQPEGMVLHHDRVRGHGLLNLVHPALDDLVAAAGRGQMEAGNQSSRRNRGRAIDDGLLHVALDRLQHGGVGDGAQGPDGGGSIGVLLARHILGQRRGHDDDVLGNGRQAFDAKIDHASKDRIAGLKQLRDGEEALGGLASSEDLAAVDQIEDLGQDQTAFSRIDRRLVERPRLLEDGGFLQVGVGVAAAVPVLVVLLVFLHHSGGGTSAKILDFFRELSEFGRKLC